MNLEVTLAPTSEPLELDPVKSFLRVVDTDEDTLITSMIKSARKQFEYRTGRTAITTTYKYYLDGFPCGKQIDLLAPPIQSITAVKYLDSDSEWQTLDSTWYRTVTATDSGAIILLADYQWPTDIISGVNSVEVEYIAGYEAAADFPEDAKSWLKVVIGGLYENRQSEITGSITQSYKFVDWLIADLEVPWRFY